MKPDATTLALKATHAFGALLLANAFILVFAILTLLVEGIGTKAAGIILLAMLPSAGFGVAVMAIPYGFTKLRPNAEEELAWEPNVKYSLGLALSIFAVLLLAYTLFFSVSSMVNQGFHANYQTKLYSKFGFPGILVLFVGAKIMEKWPTAKGDTGE